MTTPTGADRELSQAVERINNALSAYVANATDAAAVEVRAAFADYAVALGSADTKMVAGLVVHLSGRIDGVANIMREFMGRLDARFDVFAREIDELREVQVRAIAESHADRTLLHAEIAEVRAAQLPLDEQWKYINRVNDHEKRLARIEQHLRLSDDGSAQ